MGLICLEILGMFENCLQPYYMADSSVGSVELTNIVTDSLTWLRDKKEAVQRRGVKILSALARTGKHVLRHPEGDR